MPRLTHARLCELLTYDPDTGEFRWRIDRMRGRTRNQVFIKAGTLAGSIDSKGYRQIIIDGRQHKAHRVAFLYMMGLWPAFDIDHINLVRDDNRWENLRQAARSENCANKRVRRDSLIGLKGVSRMRDRWAARIMINGERIYLGTYDTAEEAASTYAEAAAVAFDDFARAS